MKSIGNSLPFLCVALLLSISPSSAAGQAQQPAATLVIEGGTLIDGNGGAPVRDALILIQGNRITTVSQKGKVSYPPSAQVIRADGKFILPGLWENENVHQWYVGESLLAYGVTSVTDIGEGAEVVMLHREAVNRGKIDGPRLFTGIARIGPLGAAGYEDAKTGLETPLSSGQLPKSAEDARAIAHRMINAGADLINLQGGGYPVEYYRAAIDEGRKAGKPSFVRPGGPVFFLKDAAAAGASIVSQGTGIDQAVAKDPAKWPNLLDRYADMDDSKVAEIIRLLVDNKMTVQANLIRKGKGFHKNNERFQEETRRWWHNNAGLRAYYPEVMFESALMEMTPDVLEPVVQERRQKGYENMLRFHNQFVQAGGHLTVGCNAPFIRPPGLCMHQELELFAEAGLKPMQLIQAVTKWPAESYWVQDKLGTIEAGKLADIVIVAADPLADIRNLRRVDAVIYDGKRQPLGYHANYKSPFHGGTGLLFNPVVENMSWVLGLKAETFQEGEPVGPPGGPVRIWPPAIETISPHIVTEGSPTVTLTIKGFHFFDRSQVYFDNVLVPMRRVSPTELQVTLDESLLRRPGRFGIVIKNPAPLLFHKWRGEDGTSNKANLLVNFKY
jgi:imidazolonepropionase-like amidohydrolase